MSNTARRFAGGSCADPLGLLMPLECGPNELDRPVWDVLVKKSFGLPSMIRRAFGFLRGCCDACDLFRLLACRSGVEAPPRSLNGSLELSLWSTFDFSEFGTKYRGGSVAVTSARDAARV